MEKCNRRKCKCCRGPRGIRGPIGPTGPGGPPFMEFLPRTLKVQFRDGDLIPIFIEGFSWENDVAEPACFADIVPPITGNFTFYKATMLGGLPYAPTELHNVTGQLTHNDTDNVLHQLVIFHSRDLLLLDYHVASSQLVGTEDSLTAQSIQNAEVGDNFYFAISPALSDLTHFNYNLGSLKTNPQMILLNLLNKKNKEKIQLILR